jgi:hypothetical protein
MFAVLLTILYVYWSSLRATVSTQIDDMFRTAVDVSNLLLTPGNPVDWTNSTVKQVGLTARANSLELDTDKVGAFVTMATGQGYNDMRSKLGVAPYMFYIQIGNGMNVVNIGVNNTPDATGKITVVRPVIYGGRASNLTVTIWSNFTYS